MLPVILEKLLELKASIQNMKCCGNCKFREINLKYPDKETCKINEKLPASFRVCKNWRFDELLYKNRKEK